MIIMIMMRITIMMIIIMVSRSLWGFAMTKGRVS